MVSTSPNFVTIPEDFHVAEGSLTSTSVTLNWSALPEQTGLYFKLYQDGIFHSITWNEEGLSSLSISITNLLSQRSYVFSLNCCNIYSQCSSEVDLEVFTGIKPFLAPTFPIY